jgi:hypothetical protein
MSSKTLTDGVVVVDLNVDTSSKVISNLFQDDDDSNQVSSMLHSTNSNSNIQQKDDFVKKEASPPPQPQNNNKSNSATPSSIRNTDEFIAKFNRIVIGELSKDFLRVKLTSDQVKKIKCSIKRAKRSEIAAIVNNKTPENPDLSFEMRKRLNTLKEQVKEENEAFNEKEPWRQRYNEVSKTFEKKRQQMLQDEYLAKLMQNEEFLNELKTDKDFIQTLNYGFKSYILILISTGRLRII